MTHCSWEWCDSQPAHPPVVGKIVLGVLSVAAHGYKLVGVEVGAFDDEGVYSVRLFVLYIVLTQTCEPNFIENFHVVMLNESAMLHIRQGHF